MESDAIIFELFKIDPPSFFHLTGIPMNGDYIFESITVKTTEKRMDGFFWRTDGEGPNLFLEVQGYYDKAIYWRLFRELCTWYEQSGNELPFIAVALFVDETFDPKNNRIDCLPPSKLIRRNLEECLNALGERAGVLTVLKPMLLTEQDKLPERSAEWRDEIDSLGLPEDKNRLLIELLEYVILKRFPKMTIEEIQKMIQLTPLEETVAGQQLIGIGRKEGLEEGRKEGREEGRKKGREEGRKKGREEGREEGELIGQIQLLQKILKRPVSPKETLVGKPLQALRAMVAILEAELPQERDDRIH